ncbi:TPA: ead/Ea22-like family protein [Klebsiella variicola subsp. variicola]
MTTDITELAQSLKAAAIDAKELAIIARYSKGRAAAEKFYALANPNNIIALVEALEKAQQRIAELDIKNCELDSLTQRWAWDSARETQHVAPVAMPECFSNAVSALESLYRNGQKQCWHERYTTDMAYASGVLNACRAAMLTSAKKDEK